MVHKFTFEITSVIILLLNTQILNNDNFLYQYMSQFDFPRINFNGTVKINPATANNNSWLPLVLFDYIHIKAIIPPRIYCNADIKIAIKLKTILLPKACRLIEDGDSSYFEIESVNTPEYFQQWASVPLGNSGIDSEYHYLYHLIRTQRGNEPLYGKIPGGWNYYGGMDFSFTNVNVVSIETCSLSNETNFYTSKSANCPQTVNEIIGSKIDLKNPKGHNTAVMVDVIPGLTFHTQIFCDSFRMLNAGNLIFAGKPQKASLRFINPNRILNENDAMGSSGTFYCVIPIEDLIDCEDSTILPFFKEFNIKKEEIKGVFIRFDLSEVYENLNPDFNTHGPNPNPATSTIIGSITPWYNTDMKSISMGRLMLPEKPVFERKTIGGFVFRIDTQRNVMQLDLSGSIPQIKNPATNTFETYEMGDWVFCTNFKDKEIELCRLSVGAQSLSRNNFMLTGGMIEIPLIAQWENEMDESKIIVHQVSQSQKVNLESETPIMTESEWFVSSDTTALYINQNELPEAGYMSYSHIKENCRLNIFRYGKPVNYTIPMYIKAFRVSSTLASAQISTFLSTENFEPSTDLHFPSTEPGNHMYIIYPGNSQANQDYPISYILKTGFFVCLRILPSHKYQQYLNPKHPEYPSPISFDLIYKEMLEVSHLIYPMSSKITPFTEEHFIKGWKYIKTRLQPQNWNSYSYMPTSRDMSADLFQLICKWGESLEN